jgi:hypothetical protein
VEKQALVGYAGEHLEDSRAQASFIDSGKSGLDSRTEETHARCAAEYPSLKRRLAEIGDALEKVTRGDAAYRQGRTKTVSSLSELAR